MDNRPNMDELGIYPSFLGNLHIFIDSWLVVSTPLKQISQLGFMFQSPPTRNEHKSYPEAPWCWNILWDFTFLCERFPECIHPII